MNPAKLLIATAKVIPLFMLGACSALDVVNSVSKIYPVDIKADLPFDENPSLKYDLYLPNSPRHTLSETPVVVFFFGGSWNRGNKSEYEFVGRRLASMGYIAAVPNYRLYPEVRYPEFLEDGAKSIKAVQDELGKPAYKHLRPSKQYVLMGHSAGAYNAAMLALDQRWISAQGLSHPESVKAFIGLAGAYNIYPINDEEVRPVFHHPNYPPQSQPIDFSANGTVPSLLLAPETDTLVSIEKNTVALVNSLRSSGARSELVSVKGTDHITLIGTMSPLLFLKGSTAGPISKFIDSVYTH